MPILFLTALIDLIGFGIVIPILPFMVPKLGGAERDIYLLVTLYSICGALVGPAWGKLSDRIGRKPVILLCLLGGAASYVFLAFATTLTQVYLARMLAGLMSGNFGVVTAMAADMSSPENRARSMGLLGSAFGLGMVVGPFLGGLLAGNEVAYHQPFLLAAALSAVAALGAMLLLKESHGRDARREHRVFQASAEARTVWQVLRENRTVLLVGQFALHNTGISLCTVTFPIWVGAVLGWGPEELAWVLGSQGLAMAVIQGTLIGPLARWAGELRLLAFGVTSVVTGFVLASQVDTAVWMVASFYITITGAAFCTPMLNTLTSQRTPARYRGAVLGTSSSMSAVGRVAGPGIGGMAMPALGFAGTWWIGAAVGLLFLSWVLRELSRGQHAAKNLH